MFSTQFNQVFGPFGQLVFWTQVIASLFAIGFYLSALRQIIKTQINNAERNGRLTEMTVLVIFALALMNLPGLLVIAVPGSVVGFENNWVNFAPLLLIAAIAFVALSLILLRVKNKDKP